MATPTTSSRSGVRGTKGKAVTDTTRIGLQLTPCVKLPEEMIETIWCTGVGAVSAACCPLPHFVLADLHSASSPATSRAWRDESISNPLTPSPVPVPCASPSPGAAKALVRSDAVLVGGCACLAPDESSCVENLLLPIAGALGGTRGQDRSSMCQDCGSVFTPGINCRIRLRHRTRASPSVKRPRRSKEMDPAGKGKKRAKRYRNDVVTTCSLCGKANAQGGIERRARKRQGNQDAASAAPPETPKGSNVRGKSYTPTSHPEFSTPRTAGGGPQRKKTPRSGSSNQRPHEGKANGTPFSFEASKEVRLMEGNQGPSFGGMWAGGRGQEAGFSLQAAVQRLSGTRAPVTPSGSKTMGGALGRPSPAGDGASTGRKRGPPSLLEKIRKENKKGRKMNNAPCAMAGIGATPASASPATKTS